MGSNGKYQINLKSLESYERGGQTYIKTDLKPGMEGVIISSSLFPDKTTVLVLDGEKINKEINPASIPGYILDMHVLASHYNWNPLISNFIDADIEDLYKFFGIPKEETIEIIEKEEQILNMLREQPSK
ncbi:MAG: hypothetical protein GTN38_01190 [Candidatus Aenigmarchaeota archaeon]|nr:hypothetical protein [Candidatus Aenigmarchaeota archaeon]NIP40983.1 hypothetical protein [Candidatus Aenigmarchaeota archaeon]NIQ18588.1 hypothetical protein [Candidatus Aenigmarchaeota archaeon]